MTGLNLILFRLGHFCPFRAIIHNFYYFLLVGIPSDLNFIIPHSGHILSERFPMWE